MTTTFIISTFIANSRCITTTFLIQGCLFNNSSFPNVFLFYNFKWCSVVYLFPSVDNYLLCNLQDHMLLFFNIQWNVFQVHSYIDFAKNEFIDGVLNTKYLTLISVLVCYRINLIWFHTLLHMLVFRFLRRWQHCLFHSSFYFLTLLSYGKLTKQINK